MNLILLFHHDFIDTNTVKLCGRRLQHLRNVLRSKAGDRLLAGKLNGRLGEAKVLEINEQQALLEVKLQQPPPQPLPLKLVLALPRPKMLKRIFRTIAELGIKEVHIINSFRVEKSFWQSPLLQKTSSHPEMVSLIDEYLCLGLEQATDTVLPSVQLHKGFKPFVEDRLPSIIGGDTALVAHPACKRQGETSQGNGTAFTTETPAAPGVLCIGPEGGFIDYEIEKLLQAGCNGIDLGQRIYRVETVLPLLVGNLFQRWLG